MGADAAARGDRRGWRGTAYSGRRIEDARRQDGSGTPHAAAERRCEADQAGPAGIADRAAQGREMTSPHETQAGANRAPRDAVGEAGPSGANRPPPREAGGPPSLGVAVDPRHALQLSPGARRTRRGGPSPTGARARRRPAWPARTRGPRSRSSRAAPTRRASTLRVRRAHAGSLERHLHAIGNAHAPAARCCPEQITKKSVKPSPSAGRAPRPRAPSCRGGAHGERSTWAGRRVAVAPGGRLRARRGLVESCNPVCRRSRRQCRVSRGVVRCSAARPRAPDPRGIRPSERAGGPRWTNIRVGVEQQHRRGKNSGERERAPAAGHGLPRCASGRKRRELRGSAAAARPGRDTTTKCARSSTSGYRLHVAISANASAPVMKKSCAVEPASCSRQRVERVGRAGRPQLEVRRASRARPATASATIAKR